MSEKTLSRKVRPDVQQQMLDIARRATGDSGLSWNELVSEVDRVEGVSDRSETHGHFDWTRFLPHDIVATWGSLTLQSRIVAYLVCDGVFDLLPDPD